MRLFFYMLCLALPGFSAGQTSSVATVGKFQPKLGLVYLVCRGTTAKLRLIGKGFNIADTNITHVGIGMLVKGKFTIYHVSDLSLKGNALRVESLQDFTGNDDVYYVSIWGCPLRSQERKACLALLKIVTRKKISFDVAFKIADNDTLYCSEFCVQILQKTNMHRFSFKPAIKVFHSNLFSGLLGRDSLVYYPVDFFQKNRYFTKVFEHAVG